MAAGAPVTPNDSAPTAARVLRAARLLDRVVLALLALTLLVIVTGGRPPGAARPWLGRAEDVLVATMVVAAIRHLLKPYVWRPRAPRRFVVAGVLTYALVLSFITVTRHWNLRTHAVDLALYDQMVWAIATVGAPWSTLPDLHGWGDHFTIILYLMAPLYRVVPSAVVMLVVQCVALALGAFAVWGLARRLLGDEPLAALLAVLFLVNPSLHGINLRDFHPQALAIPLLLAALYFFETGQPILYWAAVLLAACTREDASLALLGLGVWALAVRRRPWTGAATAALGIAWLLVTTRWLIPFFRGETYSHLARWEHLGGSVDQIAVGMLAHPGEVLGLVFGLGRLRYLAAVLAPWAFLPLLGPLALVPALPPLAANLLSTDPVLFHHRTQYTVYLLPFLALGTIAGVRRLTAWKGERAVQLALGLAFIVSLAMTARTVNDLMVTNWWPTARTRDVHALVAMVPPRVVVGTDERIVPHLAHRPRVYIFPQQLRDCDWVLVDIGPGSEYSLQQYRATREADRLVFRPVSPGPAETFTVVAARGSLVLARRDRSPLSSVGFGGAILF
jgi:uncharacterized membrane protein